MCARRRNIIIIFGAVALFAAVAVHPLLAQETSGGTGVDVRNPIGVESFEGGISLIAGWLANLALPLGALFVVYAAFKFITSRGSEQKVTEGKKALTYAVVGAFLMILGFGLVCVIVNVLGLSPPSQCL